MTRTLGKKCIVQAVANRAHTSINRRDVVKVFAASFAIYVRKGRPRDCEKKISALKEGSGETRDVVVVDLELIIDHQWQILRNAQLDAVWLGLTHGQYHSLIQQVFQNQTSHF